jgi:hypothetical protein
VVELPWVVELLWKVEVPWKVEVLVVLPFQKFVEVHSLVGIRMAGQKVVVGLTEEQNHFVYLVDLESSC